MGGMNHFLWGQGKGNFKRQIWAVGINGRSHHSCSRPKRNETHTEKKGMEAGPVQGRTSTGFSLPHWSASQSFFKLRFSIESSIKKSKLSHFCDQQGFHMEKMLPFCTKIQLLFLSSAFWPCEFPQIMHGGSLTVTCSRNKFRQKQFFSNYNLKSKKKKICFFIYIPKVWQLPLIFQSLDGAHENSLRVIKHCC